MAVFCHKVPEQIDISLQNAGQRLWLMELLWCSLSGDLEKQGPPAWHEAELAAPSDERVKREFVAEDWQSVRKVLK